MHLRDEYVCLERFRVGSMLHSVLPSVACLVHGNTALSCTCAHFPQDYSFAVERASRRAKNPDKTNTQKMRNANENQAQDGASRAHDDRILPANINFVRPK